MKIRTLFLAATLAGAAVTPLVTFGGADDSIEKMVMSASTKADHEALARHYEAETSALLAKAEEHRTMGAAYGHVDYGKGGAAALAQHCKNLESSYRTAAAENESLARIHQALAAEAAK
ncbi:MAG: hypothetical protein R3F45_15560 [Gammaproteobacteria bacterium]